jgi:hypothetical protein
MRSPLPAPLAAYPPIIRRCGYCSSWKVPSPDVSVLPRGDAGMAAQGMRPCARSGQAWRYLAADHACHLPE